MLPGAPARERRFVEDEVIVRFRTVVRVVVDGHGRGTVAWFREAEDGEQGWGVLGDDADQIFTIQ